MSTRSSRRPALKERVRETVTHAIIEAVEDVAAEHGLENTSIAAIAARAGVAVGTLYNYFADRDDILAAWLASRRAEIVPRITAAARAGAGLPFEQRLRAFIAEVMKVLDERRRFVRVLATAELAVPRKRVRQRGVLEALAEGFQDIVSPIDSTNAERHAHMLVGAIRAIVQLRAHRDEPLANDATAIADVFLRGIGAT